MSAVMPVIEVIKRYSDGDSHGWATEFAWLDANHGEQIKALAESIRTEGVREPISLGSDGRVWDGHHRIYAALLVGPLTPIPTTEETP